MCLEMLSKENMEIVSCNVETFGEFFDKKTELIQNPD